MLDLFEIARSNSETAERDFESLIASLTAEDSQRLRQFANWIKSEALISINVRLFVLNDLIAGKAFQNSYEWASEMAKLSSRKPEEILRERLGKFYNRRVAFDSAFINGTKFRYGALYIRGAGLSDYGPYCAVLKKAFQDSLDNLAYLNGDSLKSCFTIHGDFDPTSVTGTCIGHSHRHFLVAKERAAEVCRTTQDFWHECVTSTNSFFEGIFVSDVNLDAILVVRVLKSEFENTWDLAFANFGRKLGEAEKARVQDFVRLQRAVKTGLVRLEVIQ